MSERVPTAPAARRSQPTESASLKRAAQCYGAGSPPSSSRPPTAQSSVRTNSHHGLFPPPLMKISLDALASADPTQTVDSVPEEPRPGPQPPASGRKPQTARRPPATKTVIPPSMSTENALAELIRRRNDNIEDGNLLEAQKCNDEMKNLSMAEGQQLAKRLQQNLAKQQAAGELEAEHRRQLLQFTSLWEKALHDFETQASEETKLLRTRHQREFSEQEDILRGELAQKRPHFSKKVIRTREAFDNIMKQGHFADAHVVRQQLETLEAEETRHFEERLSLQFARKTRRMKEQSALELQALTKRIDAARDTLLAQRRMDYEQLLQKQANQRSEKEMKSRLLFRRRAKALQRKVEVVSTSQKADRAKIIKEEDLEAMW